jgi:hypothetical protein
MRGVVESWDQSRGRGWIRPVAEPERALRVPADSRIEVERGVLSPSVRDGLRPGQQVGFVYKAPVTPERPARAECVVVISDPQTVKTAAKR